MAKWRGHPLRGTLPHPTGEVMRLASFLWAMLSNAERATLNRLVNAVLARAALLDNPDITSDIRRSRAARKRRKGR